MKRACAIAAAVALPLALGPLVAAPAGAAQPRIYHTISSTIGSATLGVEQGCELSEVFVSSSKAMYAAQPGPVGKQGLTAVFVRVTDICSSSRGLAAAPAAGGGTVLFEADVQNRAPLVVDARLTRASVTTDLPGTDANGDPVTVHLVASWTGTGPLEHRTVSTQTHSGDGNVSANDNNLRRAAVASVSVKVAGRTITGRTDDAGLEQVKSHCVEVPRPGAVDFYPCFGFPG
jgi:hypothetical protein